jgi:hypothetical protein
LAVIGSAGVIHVGWLNLRGNSFARQNLAAAWEHLPPPVMEQYLRLDARVNELAGSGNLFARFVGFDATSAADLEFAQQLYYRVCYALWPRRMYVAPAERVVNTGAELLRIDFTPDPRWLSDHGVQITVEFVSDPAGGMTIRAIPTH